MRVSLIIFVVFVLTTVNLFPQELRKKAEETPLDCAFYALSQDSNRSSYKLDALAKVYFDVGNFDALNRTIDLADSNYSKLHLLSRFSLISIKANNFVQANKFLDRAMQLLRTTEDEDEWDYGSDVSSSEGLASGLALTNRFDEVLEIISHQSENEYRVKLLVSVAKSLSRNSQPEKSLEMLSEIIKYDENFNDADISIKIAQIYANAGQKQKALTYLENIQNDISSEPEQKERGRVFFSLIPVYFAIGKTDSALNIWNQFRDPEDDSDTYFLVRELIENGHTGKAKPYLLEIEANKKALQSYRNFLVETYLKFGDIDSATRIAKRNFEVDDYNQQAALIDLADRLIRDGQPAKVLDVLDFAYQRARKVGEVHLPEHSIGASPLTRKVIYLRNIRDRYFRLGQFDKGIAIVNSFKTEDSHVSEFNASSIVEYVRQQTKTISRKKAFELLNKAENVLDKEDDYQLLRVRLAAADVYAKIGDKPRAVQTLAKILETIEFDDVEMIEVGKVFAENKLKSDANMRKILRQLIADAD